MSFKITKNGRVTIPKAFRELLGIGPGDKVVFSENDRGQMIIRKDVTAPPAMPPTSPTSN